MDRRAWQAIVYGVAKELDRTERLTHTSITNNKDLKDFIFPLLVIIRG